MDNFTCFLPFSYLCFRHSVVSGIVCGVMLCVRSVFSTMWYSMTSAGGYEVRVSMLLRCVHPLVFRTEHKASETDFLCPRVM
jgi:hypothetical protein